jgi:15-cis-phytoene synthase
MRATPEPEGSSRYYASLYAPPAQRALLHSLFALEAEIAGAARAGLDHSVAHVRLEWWREECGRAVAGVAVHPLARAVYVQLRASGALDIDLSGLVEVTRWDLAMAPFATRTQLAAYCAHWAAAITEPVARCALPSRGEMQLASSFGQRLGAALRELELLTDLAAEARNGRLRVPLAELSAAGIEPEAVRQLPWPPGLIDLLAARHSRLRAELAACFALLSPAHQPALRGLLVWAVLAQRQSLRTSHALPATAPTTGASRLADTWQGWRAALRAEVGRLALHSESSR